VEEGQGKQFEGGRVPLLYVEEVDAEVVEAQIEVEFAEGPIFYFLDFH